ncbi:GntR family transcriptional regulator [Cohnella yongneupensis]|uniref:GntR family transcriptional regulator n=1 Tax=Cohnella yongneupensis TaxID=425006 RepID=A0ABW0QYQ1_9BACL
MNNDRQPLYIQIQDYFKERITTQLLRPNDKIPSEKELMEQFGVSRITVANALVQLAKEGWIYRIPGRGSFVNKLVDARVIKSDTALPYQQDERMQTDYLPTKSLYADDLPARQHEGEKRKTVCLIIPTIEDYFALRLISGINEVLINEGYSLFIAISNNSIETEKNLIRECLANETSGLLIFPCDAEMYNEEILALKMSNYPFVLIDRYLAGVDTNFVYTDGLNGARLAVNYLWELGHRDIAICSDTPLPTITVSDRINGYFEAMKEQGAMINSAMILTDFKVDYSTIREDHPLYRFIFNRMASAYVTLNARLGVYISNVAKQIGLKVPEDISILTFDDPSSGYDEFGSFTHISQSESRMGREATAILMNLLKNKDNPVKYSKVVLQPEIVVRSSTGTFHPSK